MPLLAAQPDPVAIQAYFEAMSPEARENFAVHLNEWLSSTAAGQRVIALANAQRLGLRGLMGVRGLGLMEGMAATLTTLATTALTVGVGLYDKRQERKSQASAEKREYEAAAKRVAALNKQTAAQKKVETTKLNYWLIGGAAAVVLGSIAFVVTRR